VRKMGGLRKYLPRTFPAFLIGAAALSGVPFLSGFFSKDAILSRAYAEENYFAWAAGLATAVITALYMFRVVILVFYGRERLPQDAKEHIHESPPIMTVPLQVLAFFAAAAGFLGLPAVFVPEANVFSRFLGPAFPHAAEQAMGISTEWGLLFLSTAAALAGIAGAYVLYVRAPGAPAAIAGRFPRATRALRRKYYVDEFYRAALVGGDLPRLRPPRRRRGCQRLGRGGLRGRKMDQCPADGPHQGLCPRLPPGRGPLPGVPAYVK
jgi:NADH-quinone oxidoreductase subunit L